MSTSVSPQRLMVAMSTAQQLLAELPEDEQLRIDTIEGETEAFELMDRIVETVIADEALVAAAKARAKRLTERAAARRAIVLQMLDALALAKVQRPLYSATVAHTTKAMVTDQGSLPAMFIRHAPDMVAIGKALRRGAVPGAVLSNPTPSLRLLVDKPGEQAIEDEAA